MRQTKLFLISLLSIVGFAACSVEDTADMFNNPMGEMPSDFNGGGGNGTITAASGELSTFDISIPILKLPTTSANAHLALSSVST